MIKLTCDNTQGKIATFLKTYKHLDFECGGYEDYKEWYKQYKKIDSSKMVMAFDIETSQLYPLHNSMIMFAVCYKEKGVYKARAFNTREWSNKQVCTFIESMNRLKSKKVLHNAYFDVTTLWISYGKKLNWDFDTYIVYHTVMLHRAKDDKEKDSDWSMEKGLKLKDLTRDYLDYGDYEEDLKQFEQAYLKENKMKKEDFSYSYVPNDILAPYNCMDVLCTLELFEKGNLLIKQLSDAGYSKLRTLIRQKHEVTDVYMKARYRGVYIDRDRVKELGRDFTEFSKKAQEEIEEYLGEYIKKVERELYLEKLEKELNKDIHYIASNQPKISPKGKKTYVKKQVKITDKKLEKIRQESKFNMNSSPQKVKLFCDVMGLAPLSYTKKGAPQCNQDFLEHYAKKTGNKGLEALITYGKSEKAISSFLGIYDDNKGKVGDKFKSLWGLTTDEHPYVYPTYNLSGTITSRASCQTPNLQQYPSRGELSKIKSCICARPNHHLVYADYSSAEIVILGSTVQSKSIHKALENGWDLHSTNVWRMMKDRLLADDPTFEDRYIACGDDSEKLRDFYSSIKAKYENTLRYHCKSLQFSLSYGTTKYGVSKNLEISKTEAQDLIDRFMKANPEMKKYVDFQHSKAKKVGYTENPFGLRLLLPDCPVMYSAHSRTVRQRAEKQLKKALNFPIQSSNAILLYQGLVKAEKLLKEKGLLDKVHFLFSVYDSFCYEIEDGVDDEVVYDIFERSFCCYLGDYYLGIDLERSDKSWKDMVSIKRPRRNKEDVENYDMKMW